MRLPVKLSLAGVYALAVLSISSSAQEASIRFTRAVHPIGDDLKHGDENWIVVRIVDAFTAAPIPGAELLRIAERKTPRTGELWWDRRDVADENGFARLRAGGEDRRGWFLVRATGYAPFEESAWPRSMTELVPAESLPLFVRDELDRPVQDALIGFCMGCGHTPDVAWGRTDARGFVQLEGVNPFEQIHDLYAVHPRLYLGYQMIPDRVRGDAPLIWRVEASSPIRGTLRDHRGAPVAGAYVGTNDHHRGPWARTAEDGAFEIFGLPLKRRPVKELSARLGERNVIFDVLEHEVLHLVLPEPNGEAAKEVRLSAQARDALTSVIRMRIVTPPKGALDFGVVRFVGPEPERFETRVAAQESFEHALPPGRYEVTLHALGCSESRTVLVVEKGVASELELRPATLPTVRVHLRPGSIAWSISLATEAARFGLDDHVRRGLPVGLPDGPFRFVLEHGEGEFTARFHEVDRAEALRTGEVELAGFEPALVTGRIVDTEGEDEMLAEVALASLDELHTWQELEYEGPVHSDMAWFALPTLADGLAFLVVRDDEEAEHPARIVPFRLPPHGEDRHVDLGEISLRPPTEVTLEIPDDLSSEECGLSWQRPGWTGFELAHPFPIDYRGRWFGPDLAAGDVLRLDVPYVSPEQVRDPAVPTVRELSVSWVLKDAPPWTLRVPQGEVLLDVRVADPGSEPPEIDWGLVIGADEFGFNRACQVLLRRVRSGKQRVFVSAANHQTAIIDVDVPESGRAEVSFELPRR